MRKISKKGRFDCKTMKITVLFTGGTIGSTLRGGYISAADAIAPELLDFFNKNSQNGLEFEFSEPINTLSENMNISKLNALILAARAAAKRSDALIITHGTDTLSFSAAALCYTLYDIKIPVVLVSASHVLSDPRSNGLKNLADALLFIRTMPEKGVFVSYDGYIHSGTRLCPQGAYSDKCQSLLGIYYAKSDGKKIIRNPEYRELPSECTPYETLILGRKILLLSSAPELCFDGYGTDCYAVLLTGYHSGTTDTKNSSFIRFCRSLRENNVPLFLHGSYPGADYESKAAFGELGIIPLPVMSSSAAYMKLLAAGADAMCKPLCGDIISFK